MHHGNPLNLLCFTRRSKPSIPRLFAAICFALLVGGAFADDEVRWYQLELLAFSNNQAESFAEELWPIDTKTPSFSQAVDLIIPEQVTTDQTESTAENDETDDTSPPTPPPIQPYSQLFSPELELTGLAARLARNKSRNLLLHTGWRQPLIQNQTSSGVFIDDLIEPPIETAATAENRDDIEESLNPEALLMQALMAEEAQLNPSMRTGQAETPILPFADSLPATASAMANYEAEDRVLDTIPVLVEGPPQSILFGTISLRWSRFLHLQTDIVYRSLRGQKALEAMDIAQLFPLAEIERPIKPAVVELTDDSEIIATQFRLNESQRIKTNKVYYFDHPLFGLLIQVKPYEPAAEAPVEAVKDN